MTVLYETDYPRLKSQSAPEGLVTVYTQPQEELEPMRSQLGISLHNECDYISAVDGLMGLWFR